MERFCDTGSVPSRREALHRRVRKGRRMSMDSCMRKAGRGSSSDDFGGDFRIRQRSSRSVTRSRVESRHSVGGK